MKRITFNELRKIKDELPSGSIQRIATELGVPVETVRSYFAGSGGGIHIEKGPDGGVVVLDDSIILEKALIILGEIRYNIFTLS